jgi:hypothetical protein
VSTSLSAGRRLEPCIVRDASGACDERGCGRRLAAIDDGRLEFAETDRYAAYVDAAQQVLNDPHACGWILDFRGNTGGNAYPMPAATFGLLGAGVAVGFEDRDGTCRASP